MPIVDWRAAAIVAGGWHTRAGWLTVLWRRRASVRTHIFTRFSVATALIHVAFPGVAVAQVAFSAWLAHRALWGTLLLRLASPELVVGLDGIATDAWPAGTCGHVI